MTSDDFERIARGKKRAARHSQLARIAGNIMSGLVIARTSKVVYPDDRSELAADAVDLARRILDEIEIAEPEVQP